MDDARPRLAALRDLLDRAPYPFDVVEAHDAPSLDAAVDGARVDVVLVGFPLSFERAARVLRDCTLRLPPAALVVVHDGPDPPTELAGAFALEFVSVTAAPTVLPAVVLAAHHRVRNAGALRASESRFRQLFDGLPVGVYRTTTAGTLVEANPKLLEMLGLPALYDLDAYRADELYDDVADRARLLERLAEHDHVTDFEVILRRASGERFPATIDAKLVRDANGTPRFIDGIVQDATARRALEEQLLQAQKMEAMGRLAGGIAHDFRNGLTAIVGYADLLLRALEPTDPRRRHAAAIVNASEQATNLIQQILAFSRPAQIDMRVLDLATVVAETRTMLRRVIGAGVEIVHPAVTEPLWVRLEPGRIEQALVNLAMNASDAMPDGGRLTVALSRRTGGGAIAGSAQNGDGDHAALRVTDDGHGMDAATARKAFEPFFTTKGRGKGTGLGLSMVYALVQRSGGVIQVESSEGRGTTFEILLPLVEPPPDPAPRRRSPASAPGAGAVEPARGTESILVAEDDATVRELVVEILVEYGYRVIAADDGRAALDLAHGLPSAPHLLLTDAVMPEMGGRELTERLRAQEADLPVILMSGYPPEILRQRGEMPDDVVFLRKPFSPETLARTVRAALDGPAGSSAPADLG